MSARLHTGRFIHEVDKQVCSAFSREAPRRPTQNSGSLAREPPAPANKRRRAAHPTSIARRFCVADTLTTGPKRFVRVLRRPTNPRLSTLLATQLAARSSILGVVRRDCGRRHSRGQAANDYPRFGSISHDRASIGVARRAQIVWDLVRANSHDYEQLPHDRFSIVDGMSHF